MQKSLIVGLGEDLECWGSSLSWAEAKCPACCAVLLILVNKFWEIHQGLVYFVLCILYSSFKKWKNKTILNWTEVSETRWPEQQEPMEGLWNKATPFWTELKLLSPGKSTAALLCFIAMHLISSRSPTITLKAPLHCKGRNEKNSVEPYYA